MNATRIIFGGIINSNYPLTWQQIINAAPVSFVFPALSHTVAATE